MTATIFPRRRWLLPTGILIALGLYLWADPVTVIRTRQTEQAIKDDPNSGAALASAPRSTNPVGLRQIDTPALSDLLKRHNLTSSGPVAFALLVDADGRVSDVRAIDGSSDPVGGRIAAILEGQHIYRAVPGAATTKILLGPVEISPQS